jgi:hypothetical protein
VLASLFLSNLYLPAFFFAEVPDQFLADVGEKAISPMVLVASKISPSSTTIHMAVS